MGARLMAKLRVMVEIDPASQLPIRILKHFEFKLPEERFRVWPRKEAVASIRKQVFDRSQGMCENCGATITWKFHMDEDIPKSKGGEVSVVNCRALCSKCHIWPGGKHGDRFPQWKF